MARMVLVGGIAAGLAGSVSPDSKSSSLPQILSTPAVHAAQESDPGLTEWPEIFGEDAVSETSEAGSVDPAGEGRLISSTPSNRKAVNEPSFHVRRSKDSAGEVIRGDSTRVASTETGPGSIPPSSISTEAFEIAAIEEEEAFDDLGEDGVEEIGEDSCAEPVDEEGRLVEEQSEELVATESGPTRISEAVNRKRKGYTIKAEGDDLVVYDADGVEIFRRTRDGKKAKASTAPAEASAEPAAPPSPPSPILPIDEEVVSEALAPSKELSAPAKEEPVAASAGTAIPIAPVGPLTYVEVKKGDNPYTISKRFEGVTAQDICEANGISDPSNIQVGAKLWIPTAAPHQDALCHTVQPGETLSKLGTLYEIEDLFKVCDVNGLPRNANELEPGTKILLPGARKKAVAKRATSKPKESVYPTLNGSLRPGWIWPLEGEVRVTSPYGLRIDPFSRSQKKAGVAAGGSKKRFHHGIDLRAPIGTPVLAARDGVVSKVTHSRYGHGNMIVVTHDNGWTTVYSHNSKILKKVGDEVRQGERIALSGNTGRSTAPHVHFEIRRSDQRSIDPRTYLGKAD